MENNFDIMRNAGVEAGAWNIAYNLWLQSKGIDWESFQRRIAQLMAPTSNNASKLIGLNIEDVRKWYPGIITIAPDNYLTQEGPFKEYEVSKRNLVCPTLKAPEPPDVESSIKDMLSIMDMKVEDERRKAEIELGGPVVMTHHRMVYNADDFSYKLAVKFGLKSNLMWPWMDL